MMQTSYTAFEFTKRKFTKTYGAQLPVWALLTSGATGGVGPLKYSLVRFFVLTCFAY